MHISLRFLLVGLLGMDVASASRPNHLERDYKTGVIQRQESPDPNTDDPLVLREIFNDATAASGDALPFPEGMQETEFWAQSLDNSTFEVRRFLPKAVAERSQGGSSSGGDRAVVYAFGGGMISGSIDVSRGFIATIAELSATQVFATQWRIAPENPYPAGVEDVYSTVLWLQKNAGELGVDPARIVLFGASAGGLVAAGAALMARDRELSPPIAAQCLRYAALDDQAYLDETSPRYENLTWTVEHNDICWKTYMGGLERLERNDENTHYHASPARAKNHTGLPIAHLGAGDYDLFRDENINYASALGLASVGIELHVYPGVPHGFDGLGPTEMRDLMWKNEADFIQRF